MNKIIIADDHAIVRQGLKRILSGTKNMTIVAEAANFFELKTVLTQHHADALVLDLVMPGGVGLDVLKEIRIQYPLLPIIVLSFYGEDEYGLRAFRAGATGYLTKECAPEKLVTAISEIMNGNHFFSRATLDRVFYELENKNVSTLPHHMLSDRELHVLTMLGHGVTLTQISNDLSLSVKTVSTYRQRVLKKMKMATNAEIVRYVITHGDTLENLAM